MKDRGYYDNRRVPAAIRALQGWSAHEAHEVAIGLALASEKPGDWRIWCLPWYYSRADEHTAAIAYRLSLVAMISAANEGVKATPEVIATAVGDAMRLVRDRKAPAIGERALQFRMRKKSFGAIRGQAEASLRRALTWALTAYLRTCDFRWAGNPSIIQHRNNDEANTVPRAA